MLNKAAFGKAGSGLGLNAATIVILHRIIMRNFTNYIFYTVTPSLLCAFLSKYAKAALALCMLVNITGNAAAQAYKVDFNNYKPVAFKAVADNTRVVLPSAQIAKFKQQEVAVTNKLQAAYDKKQAEEKKLAAQLKANYKYTEFDKTAYLAQGRWSGKRKDGAKKTTGFFGEILIQAGPHRGKVITEASVVLKQNGKEIEVPLLNPYLSPSDREILRYGNINANIIKSAQYWLQFRQSQGLSPFALGKEIAQKNNWAYNDLANTLQVSFIEAQNQRARRAAIALRIARGEKNPYFFGKEHDEWAKAEADIRKEADINQRAKAVMASNNLLTKEDAVKQVKIADEEYAKNKTRIEKETRDSIRTKINQAQRMEQFHIAQYNQKIYRQMAGAPKQLQAAYRARLILPDAKRYDKYLSVGDAIACGFISKEEAQSVYHNIADKYISKNVQTKFEKYIKEESGHNTANLGILGSMGARFNYFWTHVQNNSVIGKASLCLWAGGEGLVTWKNPSKIYQRDFQRNQNYLDYYNIGTKWSFADELSLTAGTFGSDAGVFKAIGLASAAALPKLTTASSAMAKIVLPSVQTGTVLGVYDGLNTLGNALGYKDFGNLNSTDWKKIGYNTGRGFTTGAVVGQYGRMIWGGGAAQKALTTQPISAQIANGARNMTFGMSEGAVFSLAGAGYDQANSLWLPAQGSPDYIGGNANAFAEMTPKSLLKDMVKFYFAVKLPANAISGAENGHKITVKKAVPVRTNAATEIVKISKPAEQKTTPIKKGDYVVEENAQGVAEIKFKWMLEAEPAKELNKAKTLSAVVGEGSGASAASAEVKAQSPSKSAAPIYDGYNPPQGATAKVYQPKPLKIIENSRVEKAWFRSGVDYSLNIAKQFAHSARTTFGAAVIATSLSLINPSMLNAASSGKIMPMVETLAGTESVSSSVKTLGGSRRTQSAAAITAAPKAEAAAAPQTINTPKDLKPTKTLPDYKPIAAAAAFLPLAFPKYGTFTVKDEKNTLSASTAIPYALQTKEEAAAQAETRAKQFITTQAQKENLPPYRHPVYAIAQNDPLLPIILLYAAAKSGVVGKKAIKPQTPKVYKDLNSPASGFFGANIKLPKGYDKKKGVETYYIDALGQEVKLPLLFNIDKAIKVNNSQRGVFNQQNRLEIRNGVKKPTQIERFCMLLENTAKAKFAFIAAVKNAALAVPFSLKVQFTDTKVSRHYKEVPLQTAGGKVMPYISLLTPRNMVKEGEVFTLNKDGSLNAVSKTGTVRLLPDFTLRVPKGEIEKLVKVLTSNNKNFVMDIVPTQNKSIAFMLNFLVATTIMAAAPSFKELFDLSEFWANTIMGIISFGPALSIPLFGSLFKKFGVTKVLKGVSLMSLSAIALTTLSGFYGFSGGHGSTVALIGAIAGLFMLSLSNELKFSSMSPVIETNFDGNKALAVTTKALMARSLGTIFFLQMPALYNFIAAHTGLPHADETISFVSFLLPVAIAAAAKMLTSHLREVPALPENDIGIKNLIRLFKTNKDIRSGALAFTMFESIEATLSLLVFSLAKDFYGAASSVPNVIGGVAIYAAMVLSRFIASQLQKKGVLNGKQTLIASFAAMGLGTTLFAAAGISPLGLIGAALAFMGTANTFAPLYNVTSQRNPNKSSEISLIFFTTTTFAALSTTLLGAVIDATGSQQTGFIVPFAAILGALYLAKYVFKDMNLFKKIQSGKIKEKSAGQNKGQVNPTDINNPQPQN